MLTFAIHYSQFKSAHWFENIFIIRSEHHAGCSVFPRIDRGSNSVQLTLPSWRN